MSLSYDKAPSIDFVSPLEYVSSKGVIICTSCSCAVPFQTLDAHLLVQHRIKAPARLQIKAQFEGLPTAQTHGDFQPRTDGSAPLDYLLPPAPGFRCLHCANLRTINWVVLRKHAKKEHKIDAKTLSREKAESSCFLQRWTSCSREASSKYWIVDKELALSQEKLDDNHRLPKSHMQLSDDADALMRIEAEEDQRLLNEQINSLALDEELEHDENTDWLRGCAWPLWFAHKPLHLIVTAASLPSSHISEDFSLGLWNGMECVSPAASERILWKIVEASRVVFARCVETLRHTPRVLRCWLRSWTPSFLAYPFELPQRKGTQRRYYLYHERFLCYIFRIWTLSSCIQEPTLQISGLYLTKPQTEMMRFLWDSIDAHVAKAEKGRSLNSMPSKVYESLFQLLVMFWTDTSFDGNMERNAMVNFSGVLGIHPTELRFRRAYDYTPYVSALLWVGRLIILEYALPLKAYTTLQIPWPDRTAYLDQAQRLREHIRPKYLQRGSLAPAGYLIERLQHGRAIARREGPRTNISWSLDGSTLSIGESHIQMRQFREMIHSVVARTQYSVHDLLFGWWPDTKLSTLQDNLALHRPGYSFLSDSSNNLQTGFRDLAKLAFSSKGKFSFKTKKGLTRIRNYLRTCDTFVQSLYAAIHMTSGMPARGEELRTLRWADTITVQRNIFVYRGKIILVFSYNKANTNTNNSFFIVRSPSPVIQQILFVYLCYIRPFRDFLSRQIGTTSGHSTNPHLFTTYDEEMACFSAAKAHKCVQKSAQGLPFEISTSIYRQVAVSIAKKHLPTVTMPFDPNTPKDHNGFLHFLSFQTGHKPVTHASAYALEHGFPAKLQPDLIDRYLENSHAWHEFTLTKETDIIDFCAGTDFNTRPTSRSVGYFPDQYTLATPERTSTKSGDMNHSIGGVILGQETDMNKMDTSPIERYTKSKGVKRSREAESCSPTTKKIIDMQQQINLLLQERALLKRRK